MANPRAARGARSARPGFVRQWLPLLTPAFGLFLIALVAVANSGAYSTELLRIVRIFPGADKTVHFLLAGLMALLLNASWQAVYWRLGPLPIQKGSVVILLLCTLEEFSQIYLRARSFDRDDLASDYAGILVLGQLGAWLYTRSSASSGSPPSGGSDGSASSSGSGEDAGNAA